MLVWCCIAYCLPLIATSTRSTTVNRCGTHDHACKDIAANARDLMLCSVTLESAELYLVRVLRLVHDTQGPASNGTVSGQGYQAAHRTDAHVW